MTGRLWGARHLTVVAALFGVGIASSGDAGHPGENARVLVVAYRGGEDLWPENSLRALRGALSLDVNYVQASDPTPQEGVVDGSGDTT